MLFNTLDFLYFFLVVLALYWASYKSRLLQNVILLAASYYFYYQMHYVFLIYLGGITTTAYLFGRWIGTSKESKRKTILAFGVVVLSLSLVVLKYTNFVIDSINSISGGDDLQVLKLLVPIGISFYTFSTVGYVTDVYRKKINAEKNFIDFASYISFFPHLLAGPIPAATDVLPEFKKQKRISIENIEDGAGQIIWGLFKKMVIADNILLAANYCFSNYDNLNGLTLYVGMLLFGVQMYADFSGYSDIARGLAKLLDINIVQNFNLPYFSRNPSEFWRRWHISLMRWIRDYLYIPLGGKRNGLILYLLVTLFIFAFSGLWHGANWTFIVWGLLNGIYFLPYILSGGFPKHDHVVAYGKIFPGFKEILQLILTFNLIMFAWIFFRAETISQAWTYLANIFKGPLAMPPSFIATNLKWCALLFFIEWIQRSRQFTLDFSNKWLKIASYLLIISLIVLFHKKQNALEYYYFKF